MWPTGCSSSSFGMKIAEGKPKEVMNRQEVIEAYLERRWFNHAGTEKPLG